MRNGNSCLRIREANRGDVDQLTRFTLALAKMLGVNLNQKLVWDGISRFIASEKNGKYFLGIRDGQPCGQIVIKPVIFEPWKKSRIVWVDDFYMSAGYKNTGDMAELLKKGITWAVASEPQQVVRLFCPHNHPTMMQGLLALGFRPVGIMMQQRQDHFFPSVVAPSNYTVREATVSDVPQILRMTEALANDLREEPNQKVTGEGIDYFIRNKGLGRYFLATKEGKKEVVGMIVIKPVLLEPWKDSHIVWVDDAYVRPKDRGGKILHLLLQQGVAWGTRNEREAIVRLYCAFHNTVGLAAWLALGFEPIGYMMQLRQDEFFDTK